MKNQSIGKSKKSGQILFQKKKVQENLNSEIQDINIHDEEEISERNNDQSIEYASLLIN
jgi:hypothetical protein